MAGNEVVSMVRSLVGNEGLGVLDIVRQSTKIKRELPGLSVECHVQRVAAAFLPPAPSDPALESLKVLFPSASMEDLKNAMQSTSNMDDAAALLIRSGCLKSQVAKRIKVHETLTDTVKEWYLRYLCNMFPYITVDYIKKSLKHTNWEFEHTYKILDCCPGRMLVQKRDLVPLPDCGVHNQTCYDVAATVSKHRQRSIRRRAAIERALAESAFVDCMVCYDTVTAPETMCCSADASHTICEPCVVKYISTELFDEGRATKKCVSCTDGVYSEARLQDLLPKRTYTVFACLESRAALMASGITDTTHTCKCGNMVIVPEGTTVHACSECGISTCVLCNESSHVPLRCDEVEKDADAKIRHQIEEAMTAALVRKCECGRVFLKESGCNKMTCKCGRKMCYLCRQLITGYDHFGGPNPCKLFQESEEDDKARVEAAGKETKEKLTLK